MKMGLTTSAVPQELIKNLHTEEYLKGVFTRNSTIEHDDVEKN
jgi:hypothetical protein